MMNQGSYKTMNVGKIFHKIQSLMSQRIGNLIIPIPKFLSKTWPQWVAILGILTLVLFCGMDGASASESLESLTLPTPISDSSPSRPTLDTNTIPSAKVSQFVGAYLEVLRQIDGRQPEFLSAQTSLESQRIEGEIETAAIAAIEAAGLTKQEYLQMLSLANIDPEFGERIAAGIQETKNQE